MPPRVSSYTCSLACNPSRASGLTRDASWRCRRQRLGCVLAANSPARRTDSHNAPCSSQEETEVDESTAVAQAVEGVWDVEVVVNQPTSITCVGLPFFDRDKPTQVVPAFAISINKAQSQTLAYVGVYLPNPCLLTVSSMWPCHV